MSQATGGGGPSHGGEIHSKKDKGTEVFCTYIYMYISWEAVLDYHMYVNLDMNIH